VTGNQDARLRVELNAPELARAGDQADRLPRFAAGDERDVAQDERPGGRVVARCEPTGAIPAERVTSEELRVEPRLILRDTGGDQTLPSLRDLVGECRHRCLAAQTSSFSFSL
jgi:hypothetical protein